MTWNGRERVRVVREVATTPARTAIQRTTPSGVYSERAVMISCITNVYAHPARIRDVPSRVKSTVLYNTKVARVSGINYPWAWLNQPRPLLVQGGFPGNQETTKVRPCV